MKNHYLLSLIVLSMSLLSPSMAAVLTNVSSIGENVTTIDLTTAGTYDWAAWDVRIDATPSSIPATAQKAGGVGTFSAITPFGTGTTSVRGTDSFSNYTADFSWSTLDEAASTPAPGDGILSGIFNSAFETAGRGVQFSISDLDPLIGGDYYQVQLYTATYRSQGIFSADINGGSAITQLGTAMDTDKNTDRFTFAYNPDATSDNLNISFAIDSNLTGSNSHTVIQAVSISVIPEPSSLILLCGGLCLLGVSVFRRKG